MRKKSIIICVFLFIALSAMLVAAGSGVTVSLFSGISQMSSQAKTPHLIQMHAGTLNEEDIYSFSQRRADLVEDVQVEAMLSIPGSELYWGVPMESQATSTMDVSFVLQNSRFDYLLDINNEVASVKAGEIGIPVYYMDKENLKLGDMIELRMGSVTKRFVISEVIRDSLMNSSFITSKRFLINETDFNELNQAVDIEYLIAFRVSDPSRVGELSNAFVDAGLPNAGPMVDDSAVVLMNALSEGVIVLIILLISLLLILISLLCLRFAMIAAIQEDYQEIGVMKAIGLPKKQIRNVYLAKYALLGVLSCVVGWGISPVFQNIFSQRITMFVGKSDYSLASFLVPLLVVCVFFIVFIAFCRAVLRATEKITPVKALVTGDTSKKGKREKTLRLGRSFGRLNFFLGFRDVIIRRKTYLTLLLIFILGIFLMLTPINLYTTITSPDFITYMGIGKSDVRIDISSAQNDNDLFTQVVSQVEQDDAVSKYQLLTTYRYETADSDGITTYINIEAGDHALFPISCTEGSMPQAGEIALSSLNAEDLGKAVGDTVVVMGDQGSEELRISGIYQDITNGGRTAKVKTISVSGTRLWSVINLQLKSGTDGQRVLDNYRAKFASIKVNTINDYMTQNLDAFMSAVYSASLLGILLAVVVLTIITTLFAYMLIALDEQEIAIMRAVGFSFKDIQKQYVSRIVTTLFFGIILGAILSSTLGSGIVNVLFGSMGASQIRFEVNPFMAYFVIPVLLFAFIGSVCALICRGAGNFNIAEKLKK